MENAILNGERRTSTGTRNTRLLRKTGKLPAVIYGHGEAPESIALEQHEVEVALLHGVRTMQVDVSGKKDRYLIKDVQYDHMNETPIHIDLARVDLTERVKVPVGIELKGTPKGISEGGILDQMINEIEVECLVTNIPDTLHPIVTELGIGDSLLVKDLELPPGVTTTADPEDRVATVKVLAVHEDEVTESEEGEEGEEAKQPEVIGRKAKEEEEEEKKD